MSSNSLKRFICTFDNGFKSFFGANSLEDAMNGVAEMERACGGKLISVAEISDTMPGHFGYLTPGQQQLTDGIDPDEDVDMGF